MREEPPGNGLRALRKRLSHRCKAALYGCPRVDAWLDSALWDRPTKSEALRTYLRLYPERRLRESPFERTPPAPGASGRALVLTLVPPEDSGGSSRPAQLAAELHRRGFAIDYRYALPIFPWPRLRRPAVPGVSISYLGGSGQRAPGLPGDASFVLLEAPHPALCAQARLAAPSAPLVYDAIDVWDGVLGAGWYDRAAEDWALEHAGALLSSSRLLCEEIERRSGRRPVLLPNAYDPSLFDPAKSLPRPPDVRPGRPSVVYVGALWGDWVDMELIESLARGLPDATIHLIGPAGDRALPRLANVFPLGPRTRSEIPAYLAAADVTIIPFRTSRLSAAVSPLKVYEYVAMERPVVTTPLPEVAEIPGVVVANGREDFVAAVRTAADAPFPRAAARAFVKRHTWAERVDRLLAEVSRCDRR